MFIWWRPTLLRSRMPEDRGHRTVGDAHRHVSCATLLDHARPHVHLVAHGEGDVARSPVYAQVGPWVFGGAPGLRPEAGAPLRRGDRLCFPPAVAGCLTSFPPFWRQIPCPKTQTSPDCS